MIGHYHSVFLIALLSVFQLLKWAYIQVHDNVRVFFYSLFFSLILDIN
jgi:hypothetical protein